MAMQYINYIKAKTHLSSATKSETPVLSEEDESFLNRVVGEENPPALPPRPEQLGVSKDAVTTLKDAQVALMDGAQNIPLPDTPQEVTEEPSAIDSGSTQFPERKTWNTWSWLRRDSRDYQRQTTATDLDAIAHNLKEAPAQPNAESVSDPEAKKEEEDMVIVLEKLNLAAVNNRVFSISDETQELLQKFNLVFKDLVNGVPTAYDDLESLLTNGDRQLQKTYSSLPGFLQRLIERLPETMTKGISPEIMAAAAERAQKSGINLEKAGKAAGKIMQPPSLKDLTGKPAAVAATLRSIITYLRARFPAFMGMNVLWSMAMFVLLLMFWYCHKRGREVRLGKENELAEQEAARLDTEYRAEHPEELRATIDEPGSNIKNIEAGGGEDVTLGEKSETGVKSATTADDTKP